MRSYKKCKDANQKEDISVEKCKDVNQKEDTSVEYEEVGKKRKMIKFCANQKNCPYKEFLKYNTKIDLSDLEKDGSSPDKAYEIK